MNTLYYGDNLEVLRNKIKDETVDLCYIDPPFNSKRNYFQIYNNIGEEDRAQAQAFIDTWTWDTHAMEGYHEIIMNAHGRFTRQTVELIKGLKNVIGQGSLLAYLVSITLRVVEIHRVLKNTGSFYLHCDPTASHYLKLILDSVFCPSGGDFLNEIIWCYRERELSRKKWNQKHDIIFYYAKSGKYFFNPAHALEPYSDVTLKKFKYKDDSGYYMIRGKGTDINSPVYKADGLRPIHEKKYPNLTYRQYLKAGVLPRDWWTIGIINKAAKERLGYPTQKPEALLERIIHASSNEGDLILDAYCGCGTTAAVAQRLKRNWIGIDITYQSISLILKRFEETFGKQIADSIILDGIPKDMESAHALANKKDDRLRKEFEKWAVLTYSKNRAVINTKKGADKGIDGIAYFMTDSDETGKVIFQVKSGKVSRNIISSLRGDMEREEAQIGILITLEEPGKPMIQEAMSAGLYHHRLMDRNYHKIQIVSVKEIVEEGKRMELPLSLDVVKKAESKGNGTQLGI